MKSGLGPILKAAACSAATCAAPTIARADIPDYDFNWAYVHDENNAAYPGGPPFNTNAGRGSVSYGYRISKLEITTQQWADFLNMALRQGVNLDSPALRPGFWGAHQSGGQYLVDAGLRPVIGLNWRAGAYYCNWLNNGKQEDWQSCLSGSYDVSTFGDLPDGTYTDQYTHSPGAKFWIPAYDEWLKAAHYDPDKNGQGQGGWWNYCYGSNTAPISGPPGTGQTSAGWHPGGFGEFLVPLGGYTTATSAYGLWDLSGAAAEWIEDPLTPLNGRFYNRTDDGSYAGSNSGADRDHIQSYGGDKPWSDGFYGFRIAGQIPAPSVVTAAFVGSAGFLFRRRR